ncbi:MAG: hypothetical protein M3440_10415 [Chloroflexota bacterium]|nr:hypothetical protein [Chloroflexota bacterium]
MIEQLRKRRADLIATKMIHVLETQQFQPGDAARDPDVPSFADPDDLSYYYRMCGRIEELDYLMALLSREVTT